MCIRDSNKPARIASAKQTDEQTVIEVLLPIIRSLGIKYTYHAAHHDAVSYTHLDVYKRQPKYLHLSDFPLILFKLFLLKSI